MHVAISMFLNKINSFIHTVCIRQFKYMKFIPEPTARSAVRRGLLIPHVYLHPGKCEHSEVQSSSMIAGASLWLMGGPPTDLENMADCQEWKGQRFKKIYVRKTSQHEEKFFKLSF